MAAKARDGNSPMVSYGRVNLHAQVEHGHLLYGSRDCDGSLEIPPLVVLVRLSPPRLAGGAFFRKGVGRTEELVAQHGAAPCRPGFP